MKKIKVILKNRKNIYRGIKNWLFKKKETEKLFKSRINICNSCPYIDNKGGTCLVEGTQPCCSLCGCSLKFKLRDPESRCDINKWSEVKQK